MTSARRIISDDVWLRARHTLSWSMSGPEGGWRGISPYMRDLLSTMYWYICHGSAMTIMNTRHRNTDFWRAPVRLAHFLKTASSSALYCPGSAVMLAVIASGRSPIIHVDLNLSAHVQEKPSICVRAFLFPDSSFAFPVAFRQRSGLWVSRYGCVLLYSRLDGFPMRDTIEAP